MPYISEDRRRKIEGNNSPNNIERLSDNIEHEGDLNYTITRLCHLYLKKYGEKYSTYNTLIGVLECAKQELYRRKVAIYENKKIEENGDLS